MLIINHQMSGEGNGDWQGQKTSSWNQARPGVQEEDHLPHEEQEQQVQQPEGQPRRYTGYQGLGEK